MNEAIETAIVALVDTITMNIAYPISLTNLSCLQDYSFYFDICALIFPEFSIKIIRIAEQSDLTPAVCMQKLLELLTEELQINLAALSGREILKGFTIHLYQFLNILKQFSELPPSRPSLSSERFRQRVYSVPFLHLEEKDDKIPHSARNQHKERNLSKDNSSEMSEKQMENEQQFNNIISVQQEEKDEPQPEPQKDAKQKQIKKQKQGRKNKTGKKIIKAAQSRSNKALNVNMKKMNKKYQCFLQKLMKGNKNKQTHKSAQKTSRPKTCQQRGDWKKQIKEVDDFFKSFELKIRDKKAKYLLTMEKLIRKQENERMRLNSKANLQKSKATLQRQSAMVQSLVSRHMRNQQLLQQRSCSNKEVMSVLRKEQMRSLREREKELKVRNQRQLKQIKNYIMQLNQKIFHKFQEGGELEKVVLDLYRKF